MFKTYRKRNGYKLPRKAYRTRYLATHHSLDDALLYNRFTARVYRGIVRGGL